MRLAVLAALLTLLSQFAYAEATASPSTSSQITNGCGEPTIENLKEYSDCVNGNCKALLKDHLDRARKEKDPQKKIDVCDKGMEIYMECIQFGASGLADASWEGDAGKLGDENDALGSTAGLIWKERCEEKIRVIKEKIAKETDAAKLAKLYEELQEAVLKCASLMESGLAHSGSALSQELRQVMMSLPGRDGQVKDDNEFDYAAREGYMDYGKVYRDSHRKQCELLKQLGKTCVEEQANGKGNALTFTDTEGKPAGYSTQGILDIAQLAPERFSRNAGVYTILPGDIVSVMYIDTGPVSALLEGINPSPRAIVALGMNAGEKAAAMIGEVAAGPSQDNAPKAKSTSTMENKEPEANPPKKPQVLEAEVSIIVDGKPSASFVADKNNQIRVVSSRPIALPLLFSLSDFPSHLNSPSPITVFGGTGTGADAVSAAEIAAKIGLTNFDTKAMGCNPAEAPKECTADLNKELGDLIKNIETTGIRISLTDSLGKNKTFTADILRSKCTENWSCGEWGVWSSCSSGAQSRARTCTDTNNCSTTASRPALSESQPCQEQPAPCTESWNCTEYGIWSEPGSCQESGTAAKTRARTCTDSNNCGTTASKPDTSETTTQSCTYTPTERKAEYSSHVSTLGEARIAMLNFEGDSKTFDLTMSQGTYGYKILGIPAKVTIKVCVSSASQLALNYYPEYHYGFDWSDPSPGCTQIYNKNDWANGVLVHLGDPTSTNTVGTITVTKIGQ